MAEAGGELDTSLTDCLDIKSLDVFFTGDADQTEIRPKRSDSGFPNICMPAGLPPIWKGIEEQLLEHLDNIEVLPIHDYKSQQKHVDRKINLSSLVKVSTLPPAYELTVQRDQKTGVLVGFTEELRVDPTGASGNSMSMLRAPDPESSIKGSSSNFPFWPGGLDMPQHDDVNIVEEEWTEYKTIAPGLVRGLKAKVSDSDFASRDMGQGSLKVTDIFTPDTFYDFESSSDEDESVPDKTSPQDKPTADSDTTTEDAEVIEELTKDAKVITITDMKTVVAEVKDTEYAIRLSVTDPIADFHQRVPDMAYKWPFELDVFQKQAVLCLENHDNVFVAAHTSAGKTVVAEYAIALCSKHMTRAIYTSPIKALSNQKFRDFKQTFKDVGLITGDIQLNPEASCLIMTTEILRSMLYGGSDIIRDVEWVIFDEVHYINDAERGVVWEEVIIMLPDHVNIILLSATVPNHMDFADWVGRTKKRKVYVISTTKRPVPLEHYLYTGNSNKTSNELFKLVDSESKLQESGYRKAVAAKKERASSHAQTTGPKGHRGGGGSDKAVWLSVIEMLRKKDKLPAVAFTFSKKRIEENAGHLTSVDLTSSTEKSKIHIFIKKSIDRLKGTDKNLPQVQSMADLLSRGIGIHHSGILPILKEIVELLFQQGLLKVLFATETFAMGVNMPARTVVFDNMRKHDGTGFRDLKTGEYIQMAGRAGRRGLDDTGTVIILCKGDVPELSDLHKMMLGRLTTLESRFRLTYTMMLNLLRVEKLRIQDMLKRSFSEFAIRKDEGKHRELLHSLRKKVKDLKPIYCFYCSQDLEQYYVTCKQYQELRTKIHLTMVGHPQCVKYLTCGRVITLRCEDQHAIAVTLSTSTRGTRTYKCLVLTEKTEKWWTESLKSSQDRVTPHKFSSITKASSKAHIVVDLDPAHIHTITTQSIKLSAPDKIAENYSKRQIPRFKDDPPSQSILQLIAELSSLDMSCTEEVNPIKEFHIRDIELHDEYMTLASLQSTLDTYVCNQCSSFNEHFIEMSKDMAVRDEFELLKFRLSDASLQLLPEYKERLKVLYELHYTDKQDAVQLKGKVACEIKQQELLITEMIFENTMEDLHYTEIVALLSCVVFEMKNCSEPNLSPSLQNGVKLIKKVAEKLGNIQKKYIKDFIVADYVAEFKFGLVEVVFEWARGMPFIEIIKLTDVQEGIIVRCIQRLDELIRDVKDAARIIGDPILGKKMEDASASIKRDIVFAASLYTS